MTEDRFVKDEEYKELRPANIYDVAANETWLEDMARQVGLCKSECCRFFKRQMGQSLFDYLLDYRIGRSLALLEEGGATVAEVASQVGFSNPAYFSKVFRARMGHSPREYQKQGAAVGPEGGDAL